MKFWPRQVLNHNTPIFTYLVAEVIGMHQHAWHSHLFVKFLQVLNHFFTFSFFLILEVRGFELWTSHLLGRRSIAWTTPQPFCDGLFWKRVSQTICLGWRRTMILLLSWVIRITGASHWCLAGPSVEWSAGRNPRYLQLTSTWPLWAANHTLPALYIPQPGGAGRPHSPRHTTLTICDILLTCGLPKTASWPRLLFIPEKQRG
jgi:hypothetical protein